MPQSSTSPNPSPTSRASSHGTAWTAAAVRRAFIAFFEGKPGGAAGGGGGGHTFWPSSPVVPHEDPTLLFTNAGMNQFKPLFLGTADPGSPLGKLKRAVNSQKCIRAGGKHNDLEDVGKDTYHHTFFEMLGNWSFGDYFKEESIGWGMELLTEVFGIPKDRLYATYFGGDEAAGLAPDVEAKEIWLKHLPASHVLPGNMKDNFWEMGETGPCGPCSEIHFDRIGGRGEGGAAHLVNAGDPDVLEIWNHVFIQFNREEGGRLVPLPARHVDTGMGFERLVSVLQDKRSNYDTDVFAPIFAAIERTTGARPYMGKVGEQDADRVDMAYRVIADHIRTLTFAITDGATPGNEGRGYVLRRILRRAVRFGRQMLEARTGFFADLVPVVVETMGEFFPELRKDPKRVQEIIREEEESFGRTLDRGIRLFEEAYRRAFLAGYIPRTVQPGTPSLRREDELKQAIEEWERGESRRMWMGKQGRLQISGEDAFQLYDTFGFPLDLTMLMAEERRIGVDEDAFHRLMGEQRERSRAHAKFGGAGGAGDKMALQPENLAGLEALGVKPTRDEDKFHGRDIRATVKAIWNGENFDERAKAGGTALRAVSSGGTALRAVSSGGTALRAVSSIGDTADPNHGSESRATERRHGSESRATIGIVLDKTNFYAEMGGQVADTGRMVVTRERKSSTADKHDGGEFIVESVQSFGRTILHIGRVARGEICTGDDVQLTVDTARRDAIRANHTATHLMNLALREHVNKEADQRGSLVAPDRLRFDFANGKPVSPAELRHVENTVRGLIAADLPVYADIAPLEKARQINGLRAVFGEAYPDPVRIVSIGAAVKDLLEQPQRDDWTRYSIEFCGGTHVGSTSEIKAFAVVQEEAVAKGIRRIIALTGAPAQAAIAAADNLAARLKEAETLEGDALASTVQDLGRQIDEMTLPAPRKHELREQLAALTERVKAGQKQAAAGRAKAAIEQAKQIAASSAATLDNEVIVNTVDAGSDRKALQQAAEVIQKACPKSAVLLLSADHDEGKVSIIATVPADLIERGLKAGDWVRAAAEVCGGKGGGKPDAAQGGGTDVSAMSKAAKTAGEFAARVLHG